MSAIRDIFKAGEFRKAERAWAMPPDKTAIMIEGELIHVSPRSASSNKINFTSFPGKCSSTLFSFMFWMKKLDYTVLKIEDSMEISTMNPQFYQITMQQKQTLERQIKEGLAGITQSITDFELLFHDLRKYKDFLNYFNAKESAVKVKDEAAVDKANQSLKAVFIDQVDVHTGETVALKNIAPRWPTIISDFMRLKDHDTDPRGIAKEYGVSEAEGVVLATKNKLFNEWAETFGKVVHERYERLLGMVKARKFTIDEYKSMLKPYIERYRSIREMGESPGGRKALLENSWLKAGAQSTSLDSASIWAFKRLTRPEHTRITYENYGGELPPAKMDFSPSLKAAFVAAGETNPVKLAPTGIEPFDKWVWALYKYVEDEYGVRFSLEELLKARSEFIGRDGWGGGPEPYFKCFETDVSRAIIRLPDGIELEDMDFNPLYMYLESYNVMFLRYIEWVAKQKQLENYIDEMLGDTTKSKKLDELSSEYEDLFKIVRKVENDGATDKEKKDEIRDAASMRAFRDKMQPQIDLEVGAANNPFRFVNQGQYEPRFDDEITGPYFNDIGNSMGKVQTFLKAKFDVPGFSSPGVAG